MIGVLKLIYLNISFYLLFILFSIIYIPLGAFVIIFLALFSPLRVSMKRFRFAIAWYGLVAIGVFPFPLIKIRYSDYSKTDTAGPYIFVCNHRSASDAFLVARPCRKHEGVQVVNAWPFRIPIIGFMARLAGYLSVKEMPFEEFSRKARALLNQGISIIGFPEGTRSGRKELKQFYSSIFRVGLETHYPIVPICISGNEDIPSRGSFLLRPGTITIHRLPEIRCNEYKNMNPYKLKNMVRAIMERQLMLMERM